MNNFFRQLIFGIDNYTYDQQRLINNNSNNIIKNIYIYRKPIQNIIKQSLNVLSFGKFLNNLKKSPYDDIYHLYMVLILDNNNIILLEKNERINIKLLKKIELFKLELNKNNEKLEILINNDIKLIDLLNNTYKNMGNNFFIYNSSSYNCQNFVLNILKSNNLYDIKYEKFIYQNPVYFFHKLNYLKNINNTITNIGSKVDLIIKGSGLNDINKLYIDNQKYKIKSDKNKKKLIKLNDDVIIVFYE